MMIKILRLFLFVCCYFLSLQAFAQGNMVEEKLESMTSVAKSMAVKSETSKNIQSQVSLEQDITSRPPEVGKHVMSNMDAGSMILSLLMVLALIIICALILKRFNFTQQGVSQLKVVTSLSLGAKERVMVVQMGEQQLLLGVTAQQITLLDKLAEPLTESTLSTADLPKNLLSFLSNPKS